MTHTITNISVQTGTFVSFGPIAKALVLASLGAMLAWYAANDQSYDSAAIYSGVFDLLSIFTGFLATFYVFVVTKGNAFLERIKLTDTYSMVLKLLKFTILWSSGVILLSYVLMVINPKAYEMFGLMHFVVFFWISNVALIAVNFVRCTSLFATIISSHRD